MALHPFRHNVAGVPDRFKPRRDRAVRSKQIACPDCKAPAGSPCVSASGPPIANYHASRRRMAIRAGL